MSVAVLCLLRITSKLNTLSELIQRCGANYTLDSLTNSRQKRRNRKVAHTIIMKENWTFFNSGSFLHPQELVVYTPALRTEAERDEEGKKSQI